MRALTAQEKQMRKLIGVTMRLLIVAGMLTMMACGTTGAMGVVGQVSGGLIGSGGGGDSEAETSNKEAIWLAKEAGLKADVLLERDKTEEAEAEQLAKHWRSQAELWGNEYDIAVAENMQIWNILAAICAKLKGFEDCIPVNDGTLRLLTVDPAGGTVSPDQQESTEP